MNPEVKQLWIEALRSGEYKQDQWVLRRNIPSDKPVCCALGVLCEVAVKAGIVERYLPDDRGTIRYGNERENKTLPSEVMDWAWLHSPEVAIEDNESVTTVTCLNDHDNLSFDTIATIIEEQL
jgi:hypothetical protein